MIETIYLEEEASLFPKAQAILQRFNRARVIPIKKYTEIFNPKAQNFRLQKQKPALILAKKWRNFVLPTPAGYGIGAEKNYYFSHMYNCIFDCRYCFLQGLYNSANFVLFVNFNDFQSDISQLIEQDPLATYTFFSGYDCDSLAMDPITRFTHEFLPFFNQFSNASIELRTKSINVKNLLSMNPLKNVIIAYSINPQEIIAAYEHKTPPLSKRLQTMQILQERGWPIGLRFDPLIYHDNWESSYPLLIKQIFSHIQADKVHSVTIGSLRMPKPIYEKMRKLYPESTLLTYKMEEQNKLVAYPPSLYQAMSSLIRKSLLDYISPCKLFSCMEDTV